MRRSRAASTGRRRSRDWPAPPRCAGTRRTIASARKERATPLPPGVTGRAPSSTAFVHTGTFSFQPPPAWRPPGNRFCLTPRPLAARRRSGLRSPTMPVNRTELTPLLFIERAERVYGPRIGVVYGSRRCSYGEFGTRVRRLATALRRAGIRAGDRVAFVAHNTPALLEAHFGVALAGGVLVAINTRLNAGEVAYILEHSGARLLFVDAELAEGLGRDAVPATVERVVTIDDPEFAPGVRRVFDGPEYEKFVAVEPDGALACRVADEEETYSINYTSGTTG